MADYVLSNKAESDLTEIYFYSYRIFGEAQADAYFLGLRDVLQSLANNPRLGRPVPQIRRGLLCHRHARHIVFYITEDTGIFVVRILHDSMDIPRHIEPED
ncbi:MAG TPA: type II toxin-antitoxin system RelE/ParE family toxin [Alphaproteobacteria bacterium]